MAQQMITLEEAAERLGITPEEMKRRLKTDPDFKKLSQIRDGSTIRFKEGAIEELARVLGMASDPALPLAPMKDETAEEPGSDDFKVPGAEKKKPVKKDEDAPLELGTDDVFSLADDPPKAPTPKSSGKLTPAKPPKSMSDSSASGKPKGMSDSSASGGSGKSSGKSDSDVKLEGKTKQSKNDESVVPTEEIALDFSGPGSAVIKGGSSAKLSAPKPPSSSKLSSSDTGKTSSTKSPSTGDSSEFELSLDADSDDFELQLNPEGGDEVDLGTLPKDKDKTSGKRSSASGINLRDPADSGISLEKDKGKGKTTEPDSDSDVDFELSLDSSSAPSGKLGAPTSGKMIVDSQDDSSSEFELTLDDSSGSSLEQAALGDSAEPGDKGDIFETDFEIPPMPDESGSDAVALESDTDLEKSDFELAMDDSDVAAEEPSASEVVLLEDEEEGTPTSRSKLKTKPRKKSEPTEEADVDLAEEGAEEEESSISKALRGVPSKKRRDEEDEEEEEAAVPAGAAAPTKPWGIVPLIGLAPTLLFVLVGAIMGYELLQTMWGYQQPRKPTAPVVRWVASTFGGAEWELRDQ